MSRVNIFNTKPARVRNSKNDVIKQQREALKIRH